MDGNNNTVTTFIFFILCTRKWSIIALTSFIVIFGLYGIIRDFIFTASTQSSNIIVFGHGIFPVIADMLAWIP